MPTVAKNKKTNKASKASRGKAKRASKATVAPVPVPVKPADKAYLGDWGWCGTGEGKVPELVNERHFRSLGWQVCQLDEDAPKVAVCEVCALRLMEVAGYGSRLPYEAEIPEERGGRYRKASSVEMSPAARAARGRRWGASDIKESVGELREALLNCGDDASGLAAKRVRLLLLLKTGAAKSARQAQRKLGVTWATASGWLNTYEREGLDALLEVKQGGRKGLAPKHQQIIKDSDSVADAVRALAYQGVTVSPWTVYKYLTPKSGGESWQCKTYTALDDAIERFAKSPSAERLGQWYQRSNGESREFNNELLKYLLGLGASAVLKGEVDGDLTPRRSWGSHQGAIGSHLGLWLTDDLLEQVKAAAEKLGSPNNNQTIRLLLEAGLTVVGYPPN